MAAQLIDCRPENDRATSEILGDYPDEIGGYHGCRLYCHGSSLIMPGTVYPALRWCLQTSNVEAETRFLAVGEARYDE
jgi:hypothetical protein